MFVNSFSDEKAGVTRHPLSMSWPLEVLSTVTFSEFDGRTLLVLKGAPLDATDDERETFAAGFQSMTQGFGGTLDQLAKHLGAGAVLFFS